MLSKVDLQDFFEINQGLYGEPVSAVHLWLAGLWPGGGHQGGGTDV